MPRVRIFLFTFTSICDWRNCKINNPGSFDPTKKHGFIALLDNDDNYLPNIDQGRGNQKKN